MMSKITALLLVTLIWTAPSQADLQYELRTITEQLVLDGGGNLPSGGVVYQPAIVEAFYFNLAYQPAWHDRNQVSRVLAVLKDSFSDDLDPRDYHYPELMALWSQRDLDWPERERSRARFDVLLTDGVLLYIRHLLQGKADPKQLGPHFNYARLDFEPKRISKRLREVIADDSIESIFEQARPSPTFYQQMKAALAYYRKLDASQTITAIPSDTVLKPGQSHTNIPPLRKRLGELGYTDPGDTVSRVYDPKLVSAVKQFQADHGLDVDGIVGRQSYTFLNMTYRERINSLRLLVTCSRAAHVPSVPVVFG